LFELKAFEGVLIDGRNPSLKAFFYLNGDAKGFEDGGGKVGVGQWGISCQIAHFGHVLKD